MNHTTNLENQLQTKESSQLGSTEGRSPVLPLCYKENSQNLPLENSTKKTQTCKMLQKRQNQTSKVC